MRILFCPFLNSVLCQILRAIGTIAVFVVVLNTDRIQAQDQVQKNHEFHFPANSAAILICEPGVSEPGAWVVSIENDRSGRFRASHPDSNAFRASPLRDWFKYQPKESIVPFTSVRQAKNASEPFDRLFNVRIDGLIGYDLLFDKILVISPDDLNAAILTEEPMYENRLVMRREIVSSAGNLYITLNIENYPIQFRLRTQSTDFAMSSIELRRIGDRLRESEVNSTTTTSDGKEITVRPTLKRTFLADDIHIEQEILQNVIFEQLSENKHINELGLRFMKRFLTVINFKEMHCSFYERRLPWDLRRDNEWSPNGIGVEGGFKLTTTPLTGYLNDLLQKDDVICAINGQTVLGERRESIGERLMSTWLKGGQIEIVRQDKPVTIQVPANPMPIGFFGN